MKILSIILCLFLLLAAAAPAVAAEHGGRPDQVAGARGPPDETGSQSTGPPSVSPAQGVQGAPSVTPAHAGPPVESPGAAVSVTVLADTSRRPENPAELRSMIRNRQEVQAEEMQGLPLQARARYAHENQVRNAVFALLAAENMTGIGPFVADVARGYNASVNSQWGDEVVMEQRSSIMLALFGGDREAAQRIRVQAEENERRIAEVQGIILTSSSTDPALSAILLEQLDQMEEEQRRLKERAIIEEQKRGIFSRIFG